MKKIFVLVALATQLAFAGNLAEEGAYVYDFDKSIIQSLSVNKDLIFDHVSQSGFEVYGPKGTLSFLKRHSIPHVDLSVVEVFDTRNYPSPEEINAQMRSLHQRNPEITQLFTIGRSVQGREILGIKISDNVNQDELEPEFKYISSMHGDEITGRELMVRLIDDLTQNYGRDERITNLINNTEIYIIPSMNPDGSAMRRRGNANYVDLNRNFPDFSTSDNQNVPGNREQEVKLIMEFQKGRNFALSANYHGGAAVMNYAWDTIPDRHPYHDLLVELSLDYANRVDYFKNSEFPNGITNGYEWYEVNGGMQDWSYYWHNDLQFTVEVSIPKWPNYSQIPYYYEKNRDALISFIEKIHQGAGVKYQKIVNGKDVAQNLKGEVIVSQIQNGQKNLLGTYKIPRAEFYKVLPKGEYEMVMKFEDGSTAGFLLAVDGTPANYSILSVE